MTDQVLIVNADDFGASAGVNRGVVRAREHGIVTSATLMVRGPAAREAGAYAQRDPAFDVGLHFDLGEWEYHDGEWHARYEVVATDDADAVAAELDRQLELFEHLVGRPPSHLDSHQHVHRDRPAQDLLIRAGARLGVPVRQFNDAGITYSGEFYGQDGKGTPVPEAITVAALMSLIESLPAGVTELGCHPGLDDDLETTYRHERPREVAALCDPRVRAAVESSGVVLASFADLRR